MNLIRRCTFLMLLLGSTAQAQTESKKAEPFAPTSVYEVRQVQGWTIRVHPDLLKEKDGLADKVFALLDQQLFQITRKVPKAAVSKLKQVVIWAELEEPHHPCMAYHVSPDWLTDHGMNPEKARGVEIANARNFLEWTLEQPWMVFHELAHSYHHQFLPEGFDNPLILERFHEATASGIYKDVLHYDGRVVRAYALNDPMEYFAEGSEGSFGTNDFYPFVKAELKKHDPKLDAALAESWALP